jgi:hypothetical protein
MVLPNGTSWRVASIRRTPTVTMRNGFRTLWFGPLAGRLATQPRRLPTRRDQDPADLNATTIRSKAIEIAPR